MRAPINGRQVNVGAFDPHQPASMARVYLEDMPWTTERYPQAMRNLPPRARLKAIEIANAVLAEELDEGKAIRIGIAKARQWARKRSFPSELFGPARRQRD